MVRSIGRPSILKTTALLELSESIDQSRRVTIDSSEMGADLVSIIFYETLGTALVRRSTEMASEGAEWGLSSLDKKAHPTLLSN